MNGTSYVRAVWSQWPLHGQGTWHLGDVVIMGNFPCSCMGGVFGLGFLKATSMFRNTCWCVHMKCPLLLSNLN